MKPTEFHLISNNDLEEFEDEVNKYLEKGFSFLGELMLHNDVLIQGMVKVEPIPIPQLPIKQGEK